MPSSLATATGQPTSMGAKWRRMKHRLRATVIHDIWPELAFFTLVAAMVALVSDKTSHSLAISNQMLTVLGTVLGLVVSFRTSSAYERYGDGRKVWTNISVASRNLAYMIWIHVPHDREVKKKASEAFDDEPTLGPASLRLKAVVEKKSMINLVQAFSVSVKHMLRGETGIYYEDLYPLICFLPRYASHFRTAGDVLPLWTASDIDSQTTPTIPIPQVLSPVPSEPDLHEKDGTIVGSTLRSNSLPVTEASVDEKGQVHHTHHHRKRSKHKFHVSSLLPDVASDRKLLPARNPPQDHIYDYLPFLILLKPISWIINRLLKKLRNTSDNPSESLEPLPASATAASVRTVKGKRRPPAYIESHVPLEITLFLSSYFAWLLSKGMLQPAVATGILNNISSLQDSMSNLERIRTTPIPFAYQAHLRMTIWLYLFFLPFQIFDAFGYLTIPATAFASFLLLGFLEIGQEIENPFNYDRNDLDLDLFCLQIQREMHEITAHPSPVPDSYIFSPQNQPFAPADRRDAHRIMRELSHDYHTDADEAGIASLRRTMLRNWRDVTNGIQNAERR